MEDKLEKNIRRQKEKIDSESNHLNSMEMVHEINLSDVQKLIIEEIFRRTGSTESTRSILNSILIENGMDTLPESDSVEGLVKTFLSHMEKPLKTF